MIPDPPPPNLNADHELMRGIARQESTALEQLYARHAPLLLALCIRITGSRSDGEEVLLEVFHQLWQRPDRYDSSRSSPLTFLTMFARSRALDHRRAASGRPTPGQSLEQAREESDDAAGPLEQASAGEVRQSVRSALSALSEDERKLIELCFFEGLTHAEVAERTHQPLGTIKTRIRRGLARLRGRLRCVWDEAVISKEIPNPPTDSPEDSAGDAPGKPIDPSKENRQPQENGADPAPSSDDTEIV